MQRRSLKSLLWTQTSAEEFKITPVAEAKYVRLNQNKSNKMINFCFLKRLLVLIKRKTFWNIRLRVEGPISNVNKLLLV